MSKPLKLNGKLSISRVSSNSREGYIMIEILDEASRSLIVEAEVEFADFTRALTACAEMPCKVTTQHPASSVVGKIREHKTENVPKPDSGRLTESQAKKMLKPFEVDGWKGRWDDLNNGHCSNRDGTYRVTFIRFVEAAEGPP